MKKIKLVLLLLVVAFLTIGQEGCQSGNTPDTENPYVGGTKGLDISFEEGRPPEFVSDGGAWPFWVDIVLKNVGESYVEGKDVKITLSGITPPGDYGVVSADLSKIGIDEDIYEVKKEEGRIIESQEVYVSFGEFNFQDTLEVDYDFDIRADVCYKYETKAKSTGCILKDPTVPSAQAYCNVRETKTVYNSGAPVQVSNFEESPAGSDRIKYIFTISHVGPGRVFAPDVGCDDSKRSENKIHFAIDSRIADLKCQGITGGGKAGEVYLGSDGTADVTCIQQFQSENDGPDRITIELTYDYLQILTTPFLIKSEAGD